LTMAFYPKYYWKMQPNKQSVEKKKIDQGMRERILEESIRLFLRKGFSAATIESITDAVGLSKGSFYWHFKSKNELLETIIAKFEQGFVDALIDTVNKADGGFAEKFRRYHKHVTEFAAKQRDLSCVLTTLSAELSGSGVPAERKIKELYAKYHAFVKALLEMGKQEGRLKDGLDINVTTHIIIAFNDGVFLEWYRNYDKVRGQDLARSFRNVLLNGILK
jgi:TetR/AcrR family transcriptional regulator, cholesterol catabolism regulator